MGHGTTGQSLRTYPEVRGLVDACDVRHERVRLEERLNEADPFKQFDTGTIHTDSGLPKINPYDPYDQYDTGKAL